MLNRDIYCKTPEQLRLVNNGVAKVADARSDAEKETLRQELGNFVCDGQYHKGMVQILSTYLELLSQPEQKAVWVSGFYGSGKSHFLKMLRALWTDFRFDDGATARGLVHLPDDVQDLLREMSVHGKRAGGLHAASGTLSGGAGDSVRLAVLGIVMRSLDLPETYPQARFVLWLRREGKLAAVQAAVKAAKKDWDAELRDMYVSTTLAAALRANVPEIGSTDTAIRDVLVTQYPHSPDISNGQLIEIIETALKGASGVPLTLIALDEVQQFIGENPDRSMRIQETVEDVCKRLGSRVIVVGSGQSALTSTAALKRLLGRFQVQIALSDTDVTRVVREVMLKKKPEAMPAIDTQLGKASGEIARHLQGTRIGHRLEDAGDLVSDYPLLPVRRRFWDAVLRAVDDGVTGQLRNQLTMVHAAVRDTAGRDLGNVVAGDFIFDDQATNLVQTGKLARDTADRIQALKAQGDDGVLQSRICGLVFLLGELPRSEGADLGLRATADTLADLLVTDLVAGSGELRKRVEVALEKLADAAILLNIGTEYRLQTRQSAEWEAEYRNQATLLEQGPHQLATLRGQLLREALVEVSPLKKGIVQGDAKVARDVTLHLAADRPLHGNAQLTVWARDGWTTTESEVLTDARKAGPDSPLVFVYVPSAQADALRAAIVRWKAGEATVQLRPVPIEPDGVMARRAIETRRDDGKAQCKALVAAILKQAKVWVGGGEEVSDGELAAAVTKALTTAAVRLYGRFKDGDHARWGDVVVEAKKRAAAPLGKVGHQGDTDKHPVTKEILTFVATGRKGADIRAHFQAPPFGWPQDAIDGALYALAAGGHVRANHSATQQVADVPTLAQNQLTQHTFYAETVVITAAQKIALAKLAQDVVAKVVPNVPVATARNVLDRLRTLAKDAGGEAPRPVTPATSKLDELGGNDGNVLVVKVVEAADDLRMSFGVWSSAATRITARWPRWQVLLRCLNHAAHLAVHAEVAAQRDAIVAQRSLCADPDPVPTQCGKLVQALREALTTAAAQYHTAHRKGMDGLATMAEWQELSHDDRRDLLVQFDLLPPVDPKLGTEAEVLHSLDTTGLKSWCDKADALPVRFMRLREHLTPEPPEEYVVVDVPKRMLRADGDFETWQADVRELVQPHLKKTNVLLR
jgi:predicted site-specific integrase-resolvase